MAFDLNPAPTEVKQDNLEDAPPQLSVIDLSELDGPQHDQVAEKIIKAAQTYGFLQVVNHGLSVEFLEELKDSIHGFFQQPEENKAVYLKEVSPTPLVTYFPCNQAMDYFQDYIQMIYTNEDDALKYWPDSCKEMALKYQRASSKMGERIVQVLMTPFGVTLDDNMLDTYMGESDVSFNYYATYPEFQIPKVVGTRIHTDTSVVTVLVQDHIGGLFVKLRMDGHEGEWVEVPPTPGVLLVFLGDTFEVLSNGKYQGAEHYVHCGNRKEIRVSSPVFINPRPTTKVRPFPQVVEKEGGKPRYKEFVFHEYNTYAYSTFYEYLRDKEETEETRAIDSIKIVSP